MYRDFDDVMSFSGLNKQIYEEIRKKLEKGKIHPFVGAGLTAFAYPSWKAALERILENSRVSEESREKVSSLIAADKLPDAAQMLEDILGQTNFADCVAQLFKKSLLLEQKESLPQQAIDLLPALFDDLVITTNFDETIEHVYASHQKSFDAGVFLPGRREVLNRSLRNGGRRLFKVHGTMTGEEPDYEHIIFTQRSYEQAYSENSDLKQDLKACFEQKVLLFLGCSLERDMTLDLLRKDVLEPGVENFAILICPPERREIKRRELAKLNIRAILYDPDQGGVGQGHNAVRLILEKLLEDTDPGGYQAIKETFSKTLKPFDYISGSTDFVGRDDEMNQLRAFMDAPSPAGSRFRWWGMVGPGGAGKSRVAWELAKEYLDKDWQCVYLKRSDYDRLDDLSDRYTGSALFIADYVQQYAPRIGQWMDGQTQKARGCDLRLLLIERDSEDGKYPWEEQIYNSGSFERLRDSRYQAGFLSLRPLDDDALKNIIQRFAAWTKENDDSSVPLPEKGAEMILGILQKIDKNEKKDIPYNRPLYALFLTDAVVHGEQPQRWRREKVLDYVVQREMERLRENVRGLREGRRLDERLWKDCVLLWQIATTLGGVEKSRLPELCPEIWGEIERKAEQYDLVSPDDLLRRVGLLDGGSVPPMRPDLMGEYFVLKERIEKPENADMFYSAVLSDQNEAANYLKIAISDHHEYVNEKGGSYWEKLLPETLPHTRRPLAAANLIGRVYDWCAYADQRRRLIDCMAKCAEGDHSGLSQEEAATCYHNIGYAYSGFDSARALAWYTKAKDIREKALGMDHPDTANSHNSIGFVYNSMGQYDQALDWYIQAKDIWEKALGVNHPHTAISYGNIGGVYDSMGQYDEALDWYTKAKDILEKALGGNHPDTATTYNNIGFVYYNMGQYHEALDWFIQAKDIREKALGVDHPDTALSYNNIGFVYQSMGQYDEALDWYIQAKDIREKALGMNHPHTATSYNNIGTVHYNMGQYDEALDWCIQAKDIREKALGGNHPDTATTYNNIGTVYYNMGQYDEALAWAIQAKDIREKALGANHPDTALSHYNIGAVYIKKKDFKTALMWAEKALSIYEQVLGKDHPNTKICKETVEMLLGLV